MLLLLVSLRPVGPKRWCPVGQRAGRGWRARVLGVVRAAEGLFLAGDGGATSAWFSLLERALHPIGMQYTLSCRVFCSLTGVLLPNGWAAP